MAFPSFTKTYHQSLYPELAADNPALSAKGKVIFITGGGGGIGRGIAAAFIDAGAAAIMLVGRTESSLQAAKAELSSRARTASIDYHVADATDVKSISKAFAAAIQLHGKVDVLLNNAGYLSTHTTLVDSPLEDYWLGFEINIKGPIATTQEFLKIAAPGATIINMTSGAAHMSYVPGYSGYGASKLASAKIAEYVHHENPDLRVFNLQPGLVETDMTKEFSSYAVKYDDPGLSATFCVWLASSEADFLRGRFVWANWDITELKAKAKEIVENDLLVLGLTGWPPKEA